MPKLVATLLAEGIAIDAITNRVTAFNMMESLYAPKFPAMMPKLAVVTLCEVPREELGATFFERVVRIDGADGTEVLGTGVKVDLLARSHRTIHMLWGQTFQHAGEFVFRVEHSDSEAGPWREVATRVLCLEERPHPLQPQPKLLEPPSPPPEPQGDIQH